MSSSASLPDRPEAIEQVTATEAAVRDLVKNRHPLVQLDAVLSAYVRLAAQHGELAVAGKTLLTIGATISAGISLPTETDAATRGQHLH